MPHASNPGIQQDAVDDMLVQHLLTERLIREIFDNPEFTRRNAIAAEIERVIEALTSQIRPPRVPQKPRPVLHGHRGRRPHDYRLSRQAALPEHGLRAVFPGLLRQVRRHHGIVYTPQPIVDFMSAASAEVLEKEFGKSLGDHDVHILDPCTGTGNFIVNLIRRIPKTDLKRVYTRAAFANEIMLLPYYIAALNIEHAYFEQTANTRRSRAYALSIRSIWRSRDSASFFHDREEHRTSRAAEADADHGHYRQSAV